MTVPPHTPRRTVIENAITYLTLAYDAETIFTRTKLVKLLYLVDKKAHTSLNRTITGCRYIKHYYGPYTDTIIDVADEAAAKDRINILTYMRENGRQFHHEPGSTPHRDEITHNIRQQELDIIDTVLEEYGRMDTTDLVADVLDRNSVSSVEKYMPVPFNA